MFLYEGEREFSSLSFTQKQADIFRKEIRNIQRGKRKKCRKKKRKNKRMNERANEGKGKKFH